MITRIFAMSYERMEKLVKEHPELTKKHCFISIVGGKAEHLFPVDSDRVMTLEFDDVDLDRHSHLTEEDFAKFTLFTEEQAERIIDFILRNNERPGKEFLLVHCTMGVFRSGAVAYCAREILNLSQSQFTSDNPDIHPNSMVKQILQARWAARTH